MTREMRQGHSQDIGPDPTMDLTDVERVEVTPDYRAELAVPFTSAQIAAVERVARERGVNPGRAVQQLVEQALAALDRG